MHGSVAAWIGYWAEAIDDCPASDFAHVLFSAVTAVAVLGALTLLHNALQCDLWNAKGSDGVASCNKIMATVVMLVQVGTVCAMVWGSTFLYAEYSSPQHGGYHPGRHLRSATAASDTGERARPVP